MSHRGRFLDEKKKEKRSVPDKILWKWMFSYLKAYKTEFITLLFWLFILTGLSAAVPMLQQKFIDDGLLKNDWTIAFQVFLIYAIFNLSSSLGSAIVSYYMGKMGTNIIYEIRNDVFNNLQNISMDYYDRAHSGDIISIATNDIDQLNNIYSGQLSQLISDVFRGILIIMLMLVLNWELAILSFTMIPFFLLFGNFFLKKARKAFKKMRVEISNVTQKAEENISGMKVIQSYGKQNEAAKEFDSANLKNQQALLRTRKLMAYFVPLIMFIANLYAALILFYGGLGILNDKTLIFKTVITIGTLAVFNNYLFQLFQPIMSVAMFQQFSQSALAASHRIYKLLNEKSEIPDPENPVNFEKINGEIVFDDVTFGYSARETKIDEKEGLKVKKTKISRKKSKKSNKKIMSQFKDSDKILQMAQKVDIFLHGGKGPSLDSGSDGQIGSNQMGKSKSGQQGAMMNQDQMLKFLSNPNIPKEISEQFSPTVKRVIMENIELEMHKKSTGKVLKNVSFKFPAGKTIAIVGPTGAGKTTLIKLITRFYDIKDGNGEILIDGINIKDINKEDLRKKIGMVPQDSFLFTNTILENLYYGKPENEEIVMTEELMDISKFLGLHNFIVEMPDKYDSKLMENASNLSVGQRQLIAFARVLMVNPKILILDEATSSVDPYTETLIQDALDKAKKGRTTIIIAHRLSTIKNADEIYVLEDGKFVEHGSHEELIALKGQYANLVRMQAKN